MQLEFGSVFDAFVAYGYLWKFVRIPDPESGEETPDPLTAAGTRPDFGSVFDTRLARARRYNAADIERIRSRWHRPLGVTFSAGVAQRLPGESGDETLGRADTALYEHKHGEHSERRRRATSATA